MVVDKAQLHIYRMQIPLEFVNVKYYNISLSRLETLTWALCYNSINAFRVHCCSQ